MILAADILPPDAVSRTEAGRKIGRSHAAIKRYAERGLIREWRIAGGRYVVSLAEVRALVQQTSAGPEQQ